MFGFLFVLSYLSLIGKEVQIMNKHNKGIIYIKNAESLIAILENISKHTKNKLNARKILFVYFNVCRNLYSEEVSFTKTNILNEKFGINAVDIDELASIVVGNGINTETYNCNKDGVFLLSRKQIGELLELSEEEIAEYGLLNNQIKAEKRKENKQTTAETKRRVYELYENGETIKEIAQIVKRSVRTVRSWVADTKTSNTSSDAEKEAAQTNLKCIEKKLLAGCNVCITGPAGTGKTELIKSLADEKENVIVTAPTNLAVSNYNYENVYTLHALFNIPINANLYELVENIDNSSWESYYHDNKRDKKKVEVLEKMSTLIIDEIGCLRFDVFYYVIARLRQLEMNFNRNIQLVVVGDWNQLPPVIDNDEYRSLRKTWGEKWKGTNGFAYESEMWEECDFVCYELKYVFRQTEERFKLLLDAILREDKRVVGNILVPYIDSSKMFCPDAIHICGHNKLVDEINSTIINNYCRNNQDYKKVEYIGAFEARYYKEKYPVSLNMVLFEGMFISFIENGDNYVKGGLAKIIRVNKKTITVEKIANKEIVKINRRTFRPEKGPSYSIQQYPIKPAFAVTVHSAQGQTLDKAYIHTDMFIKRQFYVAVSRVRALKGLTVVGEVTKKIFGKDEYSGLF